MKKAPQLVTVAQLKDWKDFTEVRSERGLLIYPKAWVKARPIGLFSWRSRVKLAWGVFIGKWDALEWEAGQ